MAATSMIFEQIATGGCQSYLVGCAETHAALVIDPAAPQIDHYLGLAARHGLRLRYVVDTHTHADHFFRQPRIEPPPRHSGRHAPCGTRPVCGLSPRA
ncbi:MAG: hypothetical protein WDN04_25395 [Rhodospirillales bacterium]